MIPVVHADATKLLISYLLTMSSVTTIVGQRVDIKSPHDTSTPWLRLTRIGGVHSTRYLDVANIQIDAFVTPVAGDSEAMRLGRVALACLLAAPGYETADGLISAVEPWEGLHNLPDTSRTPPTPRALFGVAVTTRPK